MTTAFAPTASARRLHDLRHRCLYHCDLGRLSPQAQQEYWQAFHTAPTWEAGVVASNRLKLRAIRANR